MKNGIQTAHRFQKRIRIGAQDMVTFHQNMEDKKIYIEREVQRGLREDNALESRHNSWH
jgi:hypothetical protein